VGGTFESGSRDDPWNNQSFNPLIRDSYDDYAAGTAEININYSSDIGQAFESVLNTIVEWSAGSILGPAGIFIFIGVEVGSYIATGSLVPGARILEGVLFMAGPENTLLALAAAGIAAIGSRQRYITQAEYNWASSQVFGSSLPPPDSLIITDTIGPQGRQFTFPAPGGKITLNLGPDLYTDPSNSLATGFKGETFVHELTHAWQIAHSPMQLSWIADAIATQTMGQVAYDVGAPGRPYKDFNVEQQALIVADWTVGRKRPGWAGNVQTGTPKDQGSAYYQYITENILPGVY
jgi:hypothetical protein